MITAKKATRKTRAAAPARLSDDDATGRTAPRTTRSNSTTATREGPLRRPERNTLRTIATMMKRTISGKSSKGGSSVGCALHGTRYRPVVTRLALFVGVPLVELALLMWVEQRIGLGATLLAVILTGVVGARLVARQGRTVWRSFRARVATGQVPDLEIAHGAMLLVAGAFLLTPGILTDAVGLALLAPWFRELIRVRFFRSMRVVVQ